MLKPTHINIGYTTMFSTAYATNIFSPIFLLLPFLAILADADHGQDSLSKKGLKLPGKHRGWSHSLYGAFILTTILAIVYTILYYVSGKNIAIDIANFIITEIFILIYTLLFIILGNILLKISYFKIFKNIFGGIILFLYLIGLIFIWKEFNLNLILILTNLFILSHIIGDYFTVSGIPLLYFPGMKKPEKVRSIIYVSTGKTGENIVNLIFTIINIVIIYFLYSKGYFDNLLNYDLGSAKINLILLGFSWIVILYFFSKELSQTKTNIKETTSSIFNIFKTLFLLLFIIIGIIIGLIYLLNNGLLEKYFLIISAIVIGIIIFSLYKGIKKIIKETFDISKVIVYLFIIFFHLGITGIVLFNLFYK